mgnify:CR=1 FL=1
MLPDTAGKYWTGGVPPGPDEPSITTQVVVKRAEEFAATMKKKGFSHAGVFAGGFSEMTLGAGTVVGDPRLVEAMKRFNDVRYDVWKRDDLSFYVERLGDIPGQPYTAAAVPTSNVFYVPSHGDVRDLFDELTHKYVPEIMQAVPLARGNLRKVVLTVPYREGVNGWFHFARRDTIFVSIAPTKHEGGLVGTAAHEIGHLMTALQVPEATPMDDIKSPDVEAYRELFAKDKAIHDAADDPVDDTPPSDGPPQFVSDYARTNWVEDLAENFRVMAAPFTTYKIKEAFQSLRNQVEGKGYPDANRDVRNEKNLPRLLPLFRRILLADKIAGKGHLHPNTRAAMVKALGESYDAKLYEAFLDEALTQIIGDLCRDENGLYVNCGSGEEVPHGKIWKAFNDGTPELQAKSDAAMSTEAAHRDYLAALEAETARLEPLLVATSQDAYTHEQDRVARKMVAMGFEIEEGPVSTDRFVHPRYAQANDGLLSVVWRSPGGVRLVVPVLHLTTNDNRHSTKAYGPKTFMPNRPDQRDQPFATAEAAADANVATTARWAERIETFAANLDRYAEFTDGRLKTLVLHPAASASYDLENGGKFTVGGYAVSSGQGDLGPEAEGTVLLYGAGGENAEIAYHEFAHLLTLQGSSKETIGTGRGDMKRAAFFSATDDPWVFGAGYDSPSDLYGELFMLADRSKFKAPGSPPDKTPSNYGSLTLYGATNVREDMAETIRLATTPPTRFTKDRVRIEVHKPLGLSSDYRAQSALTEAVETMLLPEKPGDPLRPLPGHLWARLAILEAHFGDRIKAETGKRFPALAQLDQLGLLEPVILRDGLPWRIDSNRDPGAPVPYSEFARRFNRTSAEVKQEYRAWYDDFIARQDAERERLRNPQLTEAVWNEDLHPRDEAGRFATTERDVVDLRPPSDEHAQLSLFGTDYPLHDVESWKIRRELEAFAQGSNGVPVLYHGSAGEKARKSVLHIGLLGAIPAEYDGSGDPDDAPNAEDDPNVAVYFADYDEIDKSINSVVAATAKLLDKSLHDVTAEDVVTHGVLFGKTDYEGYKYDPDHERQLSADGTMDYPTVPSTAEPGDWFVNADGVSVDRALTGESLLAFAVIHQPDFLTRLNRRSPDEAFGKYRWIRDRYAGIDAPVKERLALAPFPGEEQEIDEIAERLATALVEACDAADLRNPQLDEALAVVVGDLCRDTETGEFVACGTPESQPNLPLPGVPSLSVEDSTAFAAFRRPVAASFDDPDARDKLQAASSNLGLGPLRLMDHTDDGEPGSIVWRPHYFGFIKDKFGNDKVEDRYRPPAATITPSDLLRAAGAPSGSTIKFFHPDPPNLAKLLDAETEPSDGEAHPDADMASALGSVMNSADSGVLLFLIQSPIPNEQPFLGAVVALPEFNEIVDEAKKDVKPLPPKLTVYIEKGKEQIEDETDKRLAPLLVDGEKRPEIDRTIAGVDVVHEQQLRLVVKRELAAPSYYAVDKKYSVKKTAYNYDIFVNDVFDFDSGDVLESFEPTPSEDEESDGDDSDSQKEKAESNAALERDEVPPGPERVSTDLDEIVTLGDNGTKLFHVTTATDEVLAEGVKSLAELAVERDEDPEDSSVGLGNPDPISPVVSFTTDPNAAMNVEIAMRGYLRAIRSNDSDELAENMIRFLDERRPLMQRLGSGHVEDLTLLYAQLHGLSYKIRDDEAKHLAKVAALSRAVAMNLSETKTIAAFAALEPEQREEVEATTARVMELFRRHTNVAVASYRNYKVESGTLRSWAIKLKNGEPLPTEETDGVSQFAYMPNVKIPTLQILPTIARFGGEKFLALPAEEKFARLNAYADKRERVEQAIGGVRDTYSKPEGADLLLKTARMYVAATMTTARPLPKFPSTVPIDDPEVSASVFRKNLDITEKKTNRDVVDPIITDGASRRLKIDPEKVRTVFGATVKATKRGGDSFNVEVVARPGAVKLWAKPVSWDAFDWSEIRPRTSATVAK